MKKHSPGCQCCNCLNTPFFTDDFSTTEPDWYSTGGPWTVSGGLLNTASFGTYYRSVTTTSTENIRIIVSAQALDLAAGHATEKGIFIGNVATLRHHHLGGGVFRVFLDIGVDALGNAPTSSLDLGLMGISTGLTLRLDKDWVSGSDYYFLRATGGMADYVVEVNVTFGATFNCGLWGDGRYDNFAVTRNHKGYRPNCPQCLQCYGDELPKEIYLSVPPMTNNLCGCCELLSGDHTLHYKTQGNLLGCGYSVGCMWATTDTGQCNEDDPCPPGLLWRINGSGTLDATTSFNVLKYNVVPPFDCSPGAVNQWNWSCTVCDDTCDDQPMTLFTINQS